MVEIMQGVPGSGKTTYATRAWPGHSIVSANDYFTRDGVYLFDPAQLKAAHAACLMNFIQCLQNGSPVVVDNTNTTVEEVAPYYALAEAYGRAVVVYRMIVNPMVAARRNTHNVPIDTVLRAHTRMLSQAWPRRWRIAEVRHRHLW